MKLIIIKAVDLAMFLWKFRQKLDFLVFKYFIKYIIMQTLQPTWLELIKKILIQKIGIIFVIMGYKNELRRDGMGSTFLFRFILWAILLHSYVLVVHEEYIWYRIMYKIKANLVSIDTLSYNVYLVYNQ